MRHASAAPPLRDPTAPYDGWAASGVQPEVAAAREAYERSLMQATSAVQLRSLSPRYGSDLWRLE
eukprot:46676-Prymnesium_polylepis.1